MKDLTVLAKNRSNARENEGKRGLESRSYAAGLGKGTTSWWLRGIPTMVRDVAEAAAEKHNLALSDFLAEAVFAHAERLDADAETGDGFDGSIASALLECVARIEALESRLNSIEVSEAQRSRSMARIRVKNLVERPWLKTAEPVRAAGR